MTYRTKLFAMLLALVTATGGLLAWTNYVKSNDLLHQEVHRKALDRLHHGDLARF